MNDTRESLNGNSSVIGRLLEELSWVGKSIRHYRSGGRGMENVLTAEVMQGLDFLPRTEFLGAIILQAHGADDARVALVNEIEQASVTVLPGNHYLMPSGTSHQKKMPVQPDALIESPLVYAIVEAKRIRTSSFQPRQLAREYILALRDCSERTPLLLLILGSDPPIQVKGHGRLQPVDAISMYLAETLASAERHTLTHEHAALRIRDVLCWVTWQEISDIVSVQLSAFHNADASVIESVTRVARSVTDSIAWHR